MVIRGAAGGIYVRSSVPRKHRPDWDNTVRDLKTLKLTAAELEARSKAFKSKDWSRPTKTSSGRSVEVEEAFGSEDGDVAAKLAMHRIKVRRDFLALKKSHILSNCSTSSSGDDDDDGDDGDNNFDEDIRRLESLQTQQLSQKTTSTPPTMKNKPDLACDMQFLRGSPNLLQYLETEMQKAWSEMALAKEKQQRKRKKVKKRMKLQLGQKNKKKPEKDDVKLLNMVLASQKSTALATNQTFVQELQKHVQYQQNVIHELNEFRISATRELTNLVVLVQKLLSIQECKAPIVSLPASDDESKKLVIEAKPPPALTDNIEPADGGSTRQIEDRPSHHNGTPPKPREVPTFLKRRACTISKKVSAARPLQLQGPNQAKPPPDSKHLDTTQAAKATENKRRLPSTYQRPTEEPTREGEVTGDEFDRRENPLFESEMQGKRAVSRGPFKKSRLHEQSSSPTWRGGRHALLAAAAEQPSSPAWKGRHNIPLEKPPSPTWRERHIQACDQSSSPTGKGRLAQLATATAGCGQPSSPTGRERAFHAQQAAITHEQTSSPPWKGSRRAAVVEQSLSPKWKGRHAPQATMIKADERAAEDGKKATICIPTRKPNLEERRVVIPVVRKKATMQPSMNKAQLAESQVDFQNKKPPRYKLQGWSAVLAQSDKLRGKENNVRA
ncbi:uncharacterized protein LOC112347057 isoform X1 [Selaginella moellendorffii]|uniref:uncharacterized protein LOC112347057 isoform X1 n=1 Tax=Selaginella moellendorffii TaxID=88036 RepID=UPI000D1CB4B6|nr:uncharacterized protein LOC112347057 isoform X1 [Selaginella moellendorffii]|eukprot:XP_024533020.1 uncharacterized protein LOC112347057 isoform X1 [Selaginella moellendorffii]